MSRYSDIISKIYNFIGQATGYSHSTEAQLALAVNDGYRQIYKERNFLANLTVNQSYHLPYTTVYASSTGTNLRVADSSEFVGNQKVLVSSGSAQEVVTVSSIGDGTTLILYSPGLDATYTAGIVTGCSVIKPSDFWKLKSITLKNLTATQYIGLTRKNKGQFYEYIDDISPQYYYEEPSGFTVLPAVTETYRILLEYFRIPSDIDAAHDPFWAQVWDIALVHYGIFFHFTRIKQFDLANYHLQMFQKYMADIQADELATYDDTPDITPRERSNMRR